MAQMPPKRNIGDLVFLRFGGGCGMLNYLGIAEHCGCAPHNIQKVQWKIVKLYGQGKYTVEGGPNKYHLAITENDIVDGKMTSDYMSLAQLRLS